MEKGRYRFSVTAEAYGLTNSGISRSLASRPPYRITSTIAVGNIMGKSRDFPAKPPPSGKCVSVHVRLDDALAASFDANDARNRV